MSVILCICMVVLGLSKYSRSYRPEINKRYFSRTLPASIPPTYFATSSSCKLRMKGWWEDDLPNILGINPIEAAIVFGALYYFYGPTILYDYAREAGKLFSTYAPVVKDVTMDLFYEFREYFEEDKERDELRKLGIDVDSTPRRTTNAIERFQNTFQALTDAETIEEGGTDELTKVLNDPIILQKLNVSPNKRKSKREILEIHNIDVAQVLAASENKTSTGDNMDAALTESITAIQGTIASLVDQRKHASTHRFDDPMSAFKQYDFPDNVQQSTVVGDLPSIQPHSTPRLSAIPNKFQQQVAGEWNQRVMRRDKYDRREPQQQFLGADDFAMLNSEKDTTWDREDVIDVTPKLAEPVRSFDLSKVDLSAMLATASPTQQTAATLNMPTDIAFDDLADPQTLTDVKIPDLMLPVVGVFNTATNTSTVVKSGIDLLAEMDRDYLQLRAKLVAFLTNNETRS